MYACKSVRLHVHLYVCPHIRHVHPTSASSSFMTGLVFPEYFHSVMYAYPYVCNIAAEGWATGSSLRMNLPGMINWKGVLIICLVGVESLNSTPAIRNR